MNDIPRKLCFSSNSKLNKLDTKDKTFGCRHSNPNICGASFIENICAFSSSDNICKKPPISWKKNYTKKVEGESNETNI